MTAVAKFLFGYKFVLTRLRYDLIYNFLGELLMPLVLAPKRMSVSSIESNHGEI